MRGHKLGEDFCHDHSEQGRDINKLRHDMSLNVMICHEVSLACIVYHLEPFVLFLWSISFSFFDLIVLVGTFLLIPKFFVMYTV